MKKRYQPWKKIKRRVIYRSKFLNVYADTIRLPNHSLISDYTLTEKPDVVMIVATTRDGHIITLNEYKYAAGKVMRTLPAGHLEKKESPAKAAQRELLEETGYSSRNFKYLGCFYEYPTKDLHKVHIIRTKNVVKKGRANLEPTEKIRVRLSSVSEIKKEIKTGKWQAGTALGALVLANLV